MDAGNKIQLRSGIACFLALVINFIAYYPGFITSDSLDQFQQSVSGKYSDWHSPAMAMFWSLLNTIHQGPQLMLFFQLACLWGSCYVLLTTFRHKVGYIIIPLFVLMPFVQNFAGVIVKDSQTALVWLLAFSLLLNGLVRSRISIGISVFSAMLLLYGTWLRPGSITGALPLYLLWTFVVFYRAKKWVVPAVFSLFTAVGLFGHKLITLGQKIEKQYAENKLFMHDLTGIYAATGKNVYPRVLYTNPRFDTAFIRKTNHPATFDNVWWNTEGVVLFPYQDDAMRDTLADAWKDAIGANLTVYLANRYEGFLYYLRIKKREEKFYYMFPFINPNPFGYELKRNFVRDIFVMPVEAQEPMPYLKPWFWFFTNIVLLAFIPLIQHKKYKRAISALILSGVLYILPHFFVFQVDGELRYFYWNAVSSSLAIVLLIWYFRVGRSVNKEGS